MHCKVDEEMKDMRSMCIKYTIQEEKILTDG